VNIKFYYADNLL